MKRKTPSKKFSPFTLSIYRKFKYLIALSLFLSLIANSFSIILPRIVGLVIDQIKIENYSVANIIYITCVIVIAILLLSILQSYVSAYLTEKTAFYLRTLITKKVSELNFEELNRFGQSRVITTLTSDVDGVKTLFSQATVSIIVAVFLLFGSVFMLLSLNWQLALIVFVLVGSLAIVFRYVFKKVRTFFLSTQLNLDKLNRVLNESIIAAQLVRVLNSQRWEIFKFNELNVKSKELGLKILGLFSLLLPIVNLVANFSILTILIIGGQKVLENTFSVGNLSAFITYVGLLIMPIAIISFISNQIARAITSLNRIEELLNIKVKGSIGNLTREIEGRVEFKNVSLEIDNRKILKDISFIAKAKQRTAIIGPVASGKTQLFNLIISLIKPTSGQIYIDHEILSNHSTKHLFKNIGVVFQDSVVFNSSIIENIKFGQNVADKDIKKALETAEMDKFIDTLKNGYESIISERGNDLSGGQKQRLTLARALAINPKILLLDDFTARIDIKTEKRIFENLKKNYPDLTIIQISQKIYSIEDFDQIILIMNGELVAKGTHQELLKSCFEYKQIYESQKSLNELQPD